MQRDTKIFIAVAVLAAVVLWAMGPSDGELDQQQYCRMVDLYKADHTTGWPDFHHTYNKYCKGDGHAR